MTLVTATMTRRAKPFVKWAGGKTQLIDEIDARLPKKEIEAGEIDTYVEPFVGGGAVFFHIAQYYPQFKRFCVLDVNDDLVKCYNAIKSDVAVLIRRLRGLENHFRRLGQAERKDFYYEIRRKFNNKRDVGYLIFLNKTCYNGLYRVNRNNEFNAPFGYYQHPRICDRQNLEAASSLLQKAEIEEGDFTQAVSCIDDRTFVYFDPPYRPISRTASFTAYSKDCFSEADQVRLAEFCKKITAKGARFLLSNSDPKNQDPSDTFFETHYSASFGFHIDNVVASRVINCKASGRGRIRELLITNYEPDSMADNPEGG